MPPGVIRFIARQGQPATFTARQRLVSTGGYITQETVASIAYAIWDLRQSPPLQILAGSITVAASVFDTLQVDPILFPLDSTGYNFKWTTPQLAFPNAVNGQSYLVDIVFTDTLGFLTSLSYLTSEVVPVQSSPL